MTEYPKPLLEELAAGRDAALTKIAAAARQASVGALLSVGSLGRGTGDEFSDLDLIMVPGPHGQCLDLHDLFGGQVVAVLDKPSNAPEGGSYTGICLAVAGMACWIDWYVWPAVTAAVPTDGVVLLDDHGLPASSLHFMALLDTVRTKTVQPVDPLLDLLLRVAVAAKYLARGDRPRVHRLLPETTTLQPSDVIGYLHDRLAGIIDPRLGPAVACTGRLVDLAGAVAGAR
jgi:hypothetical protein